LGLSFEPAQVRSTADAFQRHGVSSERLRFQVMNLYDLPKLGRRFDQIICSETLEHIRDDQRIISYFHDLLRPGVFCIFAALTHRIP
jgi:2-polyprenyl-3-methyl-5-hydroxy-6-metoxy-1,4-benzoquinol methylase